MVLSFSVVLRVKFFVFNFLVVVKAFVLVFRFHHIELILVEWFWIMEIGACLRRIVDERTSMFSEDAIGLDFVVSSIARQ